MSLLPILILTGFTLTGLLIRSREGIVRNPQLANKLGVIGAMSAGALLIWMIASVLRSSIVLMLSPSARLIDFAFATVSLFGVEAWFFLGGIWLESKSSLSGRYQLEDEWWPSFFDGLAAGVIVTAVCTVISFPIWWAIRPGDHGKFGGSLAGFLVAERVTDAFEPNEIVRTASELAMIEQRKAIPHAIVLAPFVALVFPIGYRFYQFSRRELSDQYQHRYAVDVPDSPGGSLPYPPRGGGLN